MRRTVFILFSLFYLVVTSGVAVNVHYCEGKVKYVDVIPDKDHTCCPEEGHTDACCDDKKVYFQLNIEQITNQNTRVVPVQTELGEADEIDAFSYREITSEDGYLEYGKSPTPIKQPVWLLNCSFLFYG